MTPEPLKELRDRACRGVSIVAIDELYEAALAQLAQVTAERDEARRFGEDAARQHNELLEAHQRVTCAFCGEEFQRGTPRHGDGQLAAHVRVCPQHPMREAEAALARLRAAHEWQPIETAPKGSWPDGPDDTRDPAYIKPPDLWLLLADGQRCVGSFDAYYAEGGNGYDGDTPWVESFSGERVRPVRWMLLPPAPAAPGEE